MLREYFGHEVYFRILWILAGILIILASYTRFTYFFIIQHLKKSDPEIINKYGGFNWFPIWKYPKFHFAILRGKVRAVELQKKLDNYRRFGLILTAVGIITIIWIILI